MTHTQNPAAGDSVRDTGRSSFGLEKSSDTTKPTYQITGAKYAGPRYLRLDLDNDIRSTGEAAPQVFAEVWKIARPL